jgi:hypothetical protein
MLGILLGVLCLLLGAVNLIYYVNTGSSLQVIAMIICFVCAGINIGVGVNRL